MGHGLILTENINNTAKIPGFFKKGSGKI